MNWNELLAAALTLVFRYLLGWLFTLINFPVDEAFLNALVTAIVVYLLALFGVNVARAAKLRGIK